MKKFLVCICIFSVMLAAVSLTSCKKNKETFNYGDGKTLSEVDIPATIPFVTDFTYDYYDGNGEKVEDKSTAFDLGDEIKVRVGCTLSEGAFAAGKKKFTIRLALSEGFDGRIYSANSSTTEDDELTVTFTADDKPKKCEMEVKIRFNYNSGNLRVNYRYDDEEYAVAAISPLKGSKPLKFTYDEASDGYVVERGSEVWFKDFTEFIVPSEYKGVPVTGIGGSLFMDCESLKSVTLPSTITSIGEWAFHDCDSLESITLPSALTSIGDNAFYDCSSLKSVTIPDSVKRIGTDAFSSCWSLEEVILPEGIEDIGFDAFEGQKLSFSTYDKGYYLGSPENEFRYLLEVDYGTENIVVHEDCEVIGRYAFNYKKRYHGDSDLPVIKSVTLPSGVKTVGEGAFYCCESLETAALSDSLTSIGNQAFLDCTSLKSVTFGNSLEYIGDEAFRWCSSLADMTLSDTVAYFGSGAFWSCEKLYTAEDETGYYLGTKSNKYAVLMKGKKKTAEDTYVEDVRVRDGCVMIGPSAFEEFLEIDTVVLPDSVKIIERAAFKGCKGLESIDMPYVTRVGDSAFEGCSWYFAGINMPSVTSVGSSAFSGCAKLTSIEMPSVKSIGAGAFAGCFDGVEVYTLPSGVTSIDSEAFAGCKFKTVILPDGLKTIGDSAFEGCPNLETVSFPQTLTEIGNSAFAECKSLKTVILPSSVVSIGEEAFCECSSLTTVDLPVNLQKIKYRTFWSCNSLTKITLRGNINLVEEGALNWCLQLEEITFIGTRKAWLDILSVSNAYFTDTVLTAHCVDGDLAFEAYDGVLKIYT